MQRRRPALSIFVLLALLLAFVSRGFALSINVTESFESGADGWTTSGTHWAVGKPTGGPKAAHTGSDCAAVSLTGVYTGATTSQFISPTFAVPAATSAPRLTFWQWYSFYVNGSASEYGAVQIRVAGTTTWTTLSGPYYGTSSAVWSEGSIDLTAYAGKSVQVAFTMTSASSSTGMGWFIDDVTVTTGTTAFAANTTDDFESGLQSWTIEGSFWQVGKPTGGPKAAHSGTNCAALNLAGDYPGLAANEVSRLVSPAFTVPAASSAPRLTFWQWYSFYVNGSASEAGTVQIRAAGSTTWTTLTGPYYGANSPVWAEAAIDLSAYAGQSVQVSFTFTPGGSSAADGWFVDDVTLSTGTSTLTPNSTMNFDSGLGAWNMTGDLWQVGVPTGGPAAPHSGTSCAALCLAGSYPTTTSSLVSQLVSPSFTVPAANMNPRLTFWQWYSFYVNGSASESAEIQIRVGGSTTWTTLNGPAYGANSPVWAEDAIDLKAYAGQVVQVAFTFTPGGSSTGKGWYIDDVTLETSTSTLVPNTTMNFDSGLGAWDMTGDLWQVGKPTGGPGVAHSGTNCAALCLSGSYPSSSASLISQLVSPVFTVPAANMNPHLTFWQWYSFYVNGSASESGTVQIRAAGATTWTTLTGPYYGANSPVWAEGSVDLSAYAGQSVQVAFTFTPGGSSTGKGWFIDDITLSTSTSTLTANSTDTFESGLGAWSISGDLWQVGVPTGGPAVAHSGTNCAALCLSGSYTGSSSSIVSRLVSPPFTVPAANQNPKLSFWQWYSLYVNGSASESANVQIRVAGSTTWTSLLSGPQLGANSPVWAQCAIDLSAYAGESVQVAFTFTPGGSSTGKGWFIDDVALTTSTSTLTANSTFNFDSGLGAWSMTGPLWQVGKPTGGPATTHSGADCAALSLSGAYTGESSSAVSRLVSPPFAVPAESQNPHLTFWQWYSFYVNGSASESGTVQIRVAGATTWTTLAGTYYGANSPVWAEGSVDLTSYAGQTVQVAFSFTPGGSSTGKGWFIDDVTLSTSTSTLTANSTMNFDSGLGAWSISGGLWQVGTPTGGPAAAHSGAQCAALCLSGSYTGTSSSIVSRLVSPPFTVPAASQNPRLSFWQWYSFYVNGSASESANVQIRVAGSTTWTNLLSGPYIGANSPVWAQSAIDLSAYAGKSVQVAFTYTPGGSSTGKGWFVDDVALATGSLPLVPNITNTFESGLGGWMMSGNEWQVGKPTGSPAAAHAGTNCAAICLSGSYTGGADTAVSRLVSQPFLMPDASQSPKMTFWQYYSFYVNGSASESGKVQILVSGSTTWTTLATYSGASAAGWTEASIGLSSYGGKTVQLAFTYTPGGSSTGKGWFIDDVTVVAPPKPQTITFGSISGKTYGAAPFTVSATATSGLPVTFSVASGPATVSGSTVTITGAGTVGIKAAQAGNPYWAAATSVTNSFAVAKEAQTIGAFSTIPTQSYPGSITIVPPMASSGLTVTVTVKSGPATISGNKVTFTGPGTVVLAGDQAGNTNYLAAKQVTTSFAVQPGVAGG